MNKHVIVWKIARDTDYGLCAQKQAESEWNMRGILMQ